MLLSEHLNPFHIQTDVVDASITTAITSRLLLNTEINSLSIDVDTTDQTVALSGTVENKLEKELVERIAANTSNVDEVINRLKYTN